MSMKMYKITEQSAQAILDYLSKRPYVEVFQLVRIIQGLEILQEVKAEDKPIKK
jgi:hypothetical protein